MWLISKFRSVKVSAVALVMFAVMSVTSLCQAQTPIPVTVDIPNIDYVGIVTSLMAAIALPLAGAIGFGISIWAFAFIYKKFKSFAR